MTSHLTIVVAKKRCGILLHMQDPLETLSRVLKVFYERRIKVEWMQFCRLEEVQKDLLTIHCQIDKDKVAETINALHYTRGIIDLERLDIE